MYDFVSFPFYFAYQKPWNTRKNAAKVRAVSIERTKDSITFKPVKKTCPGLDHFLAENIQTMDKCFDYAVNQHSYKPMVGTREILSEEDEKQADGRVYKKWNMGEYKWKSYLQVNDSATNFGRGLRELGLKPRNKICIFADTKEEWMIGVLGCFKQKFPCSHTLC